MRLLPLSILRIRNWIPFILNYAGFRDKRKRYLFRNGTLINTGGGVDASTLYVVYFKKDYGDVYGNESIIDIGANIGAFSIYAANQSPKAMIYAYEPNRSNFQILKNNIEENNLHGRVVIHNLGVAAAKGSLKLYISEGSPYHSIYPSAEKQKYIEMSCCRLKDIFTDNDIKKCDLLKIDCEGAEYEIFYNTPAEYFAKIDRIRMEYHNRDIPEYNIDSLTEFFKTMGFQIVHKDKNALIAWFERRAA